MGASRLGFHFLSPIPNVRVSPRLCGPLSFPSDPSLPPPVVSLSCLDSFSSPCPRGEGASGLSTRDPWLLLSRVGRLGVFAFQGTGGLGQERFRYHRRTL